MYSLSTSKSHLSGLAITPQGYRFTWNPWGASLAAISKNSLKVISPFMFSANNYIYYLLLLHLFLSIFLALLLLPFHYWASQSTISLTLAPKCCHFCSYSFFLAFYHEATAIIAVIPAIFVWFYVSASAIHTH